MITIFATELVFDDWGVRLGSTRLGSQFYRELLPVSPREGRCWNWLLVAGWRASLVEAHFLALLTEMWVRGCVVSEKHG